MSRSNTYCRPLSADITQPKKERPLNRSQRGCWRHSARPTKGRQWPGVACANCIAVLRRQRHAGWGVSPDRSSLCSHTRFCPRSAASAEREQTAEGTQAVHRGSASRQRRMGDAALLPSLQHARCSAAIAASCIAATCIAATCIAATCCDCSAPLPCHPAAPGLAAHRT